MRRVADRLDRLRGACRTIYFDGDDDACVQWPEIAGAVDCYVKKHVFANQDDYTRDYVGKSNLTDYVHRTHGISFELDPIPGTVRPDLRTGESHPTGVESCARREDRHALAALEYAPGTARRIDVVCRASVPADSWIQPLRQSVTEALRELARRRPVLLPIERVSQDRYNEEMLASRICVSPFGYGEICWRDFEAVACGCLLVKPDMSHIRTTPDIFVRGETYVPVRWDFADLVETCEHYLARPDELSRIVANARTVLDDWYRREGVVERILDVLYNRGGSDADGV